jgi:site-specific DNA-methyltransferase (adenine-specific)
MGLVKLIHGDCLIEMDKLIEQGVKVDAIITDPPYNISKENNFKTMKDRKNRVGMDFGEWDKGADLFSYISKIPKLLKVNGNFIVFNDWKNLGDIEKICEKNCLHAKRCLVFKKKNPAPFNRDRLNVNDVEFAIWFVLGKQTSNNSLISKKWVFNRHTPLQSCVFEYVVESGGGFKKYHPTQKSVKQMEKLLLIYTNENDVVLDPFMGSGTTGVACINTGRNFIGIELDENYFNISVDRINKAKEKKELSFFVVD